MLKKLLLLLIFLVYINISYASYFISIDIPPESLAVKPGDNLNINIDIISLDKQEVREDYNLVVYILDENNNKILESNKILAMQNEASTTVNFDIPKSIKPGVYIIKVILDGNEKTGRFVVLEESETNYNIYIIYILLFIFMCFFLVFYIYNRKLNKLVKHIRKVHMRDIVKKRR